MEEYRSATIPYMETSPSVQLKIWCSLPNWKSRLSIYGLYSASLYSLRSHSIKHMEGDMLRNIAIVTNASVSALLDWIAALTQKNQTTKILTTPIVATLLFCASSVQATAQDTSTVMFNAYAQSTLYPESFDSYIRQNRSLFNQSFEICLGRLFKKYAPQVEAHMSYCRRIPDPRMRGECISRNKSAAVVGWTSSMVETLEGHPWCMTFTGSFTCPGKKGWEALMPGFYVPMMENWLPTVRPIFQCE